MVIDTRALGFTLTTSIEAHVESRLAHAIGPFENRLLGVTVRVDDVNAGRGGVDKRCSVVVTVPRRAAVMAEATHQDLYAAVDEAASRVRRSLKRALKRHVSRERKNPQRPGAMTAA